MRQIILLIELELSADVLQRTALLERSVPPLAKQCVGNVALNRLAALLAAPVEVRNHVAAQAAELLNHRAHLRISRVAEAEVEHFEAYMVPGRFCKKNSLESTQLGLTVRERCAHACTVDHDQDARRVVQVCATHLAVSKRLRRSQIAPVYS